MLSSSYMNRKAISIFRGLKKKTAICALSAAYGIAVAIYCCQWLKIALPLWVNNYANDFLCLPIVLGTTTLLIRLLKKDRSYNIPPAAMLCMACYYSLYFELYLPTHHARYTGDILDAVLYFASAFLFYLASRPGKS